MDASFHSTYKCVNSASVFDLIPMVRTLPRLSRRSALCYPLRFPVNESEQRITGPFSPQKRLLKFTTGEQTRTPESGKESGLAPTAHPPVTRALSRKRLPISADKD